MTKMLDCVDKLAAEIGARPVGTDEEQQAAFFIEDTLKRQTNFKVDLQEFDAVKSPEMGRVACGVLTLLGCVLSFVLGSVPAVPLLLTLAGGVLFALNELGIFSLAPFFGKAPSQNVVAKHKPAGGGDSHKKIVILTNYDSEKSRADEASGAFAQLGHIKMFELGAFGAAFLACLIAFFAGGNAFVTILLVLGIVGSALPIVAFAVHSTGKFNVGANNNAASVAVMLEAAKRISTGVYAPLGETPVIHGAAAAQAQGAIPEGVDVSWEADFNVSKEANDAVQSMFFNKNHVEEEVAQEVVQSQPEVILQPEVETQVQQVKQQVVTYDNPPAPLPATTSAPDWFTRGKEKAGDKGNVNAGKVRRSAYGDAMSNADRIVADAHDSRAEASDLQQKLQAIQNQIAQTSTTAENSAAHDAEVAQKVLENEIKEQPAGVSGFLEKETSAVNFEASKEEESREVAAVKQEVADVPALKPLEPEYGVEVDPNDFLDNSKTAPMNAVDAPPAQPEVVPEPEVVEAPKREIALPSLTGALESNKLNERLQREKEEEERARKQKENAQAQRSLSVNLPSLASDVSAKHGAAQENKAVSNVGAFGVGEATGTFAPITDEDLRRANAGEDDMYVYDADDSALQNATDSGAVAGQGYVDIPDTHTESIFGKLFHKNEEISTDVWDDEDDWNGGAVVVGESTPEQIEAFNERDEIYNFATNDVSAEVWCVALGAEASNHSGLENFLATNGADLKGAKFITLDAMGAGNLSVVEKEGVFKPQSVQTRMKRFARDSAKSLGISAKSEKIMWKETTSSKLGEKGYKYVHLAGFEGGKPALYSSDLDTPEAIDEDALQTSADYVMELVRTL